MADAAKAEGSKAKSWTADEKLDILMYMLDVFAPKIEWKKLENIPSDRTPKAVQLMYQREKARCKKDDEGEGSTNKKAAGITSDAEDKKPKAKATARKTKSESGQESSEEPENAKKTKSSTKAKPTLQPVKEDSDGEESSEKVVATKPKTQAGITKKPRAKKSDGEEGGKIPLDVKKRKGSAKANKADSGVDEAPAKKAKTNET